MAVVIREDLVVGAQYSFDKDGGYCTRVFHVSGLPGNLGLQQSCYLAATARDIATGQGIPVYGQSHPTIPGIFSQGGTAVPFPSDSRVGFKVTVPYSWQSFSVNSIQVKITGTRNVIHTNRDLSTGKILSVEYRYIQTLANGNQVGKSVSNMVTFDVFSNHLMLEISRIEVGSPKVKAANYSGRVNSDAGWQGIGQANTWLCQSIEGDKQTGNTYNVTYVFEYAPEGWGQLAVYQDPATHITPPDVFIPPPQALQGIIQQTGQISNGLFGYVPASAAFSSLGLPNI